MNDAGRVRLCPRGRYSLEEDYIVYDAVSFEGSVYVAVRPNRGVSPDTPNSDVWVAWQDITDFLADIVESSKDILDEDLERAMQYAQNSKSWAVGHTGTREDENINCSEYFATVASNAKDRASDILGDTIEAGQNALDMINESLSGIAPKILVDPITGHLFWEGGRFILSVNEGNGHLEYGIAI